MSVMLLKAVELDGRHCAAEVSCGMFQSRVAKIRAED